jgi:Rps23 Pro-64 3,4-dihydroxylase Tpa1-like proline 4-hydroxylase
MKETPSPGPVPPELIIACFVVAGFIVTLFYSIFKGHNRTSANSDQLASVLILPAIKTMIDEIKTALELQLKIDLSSDVTLGAHLYDEHSVIGFHTDYSVTRDVRFVLNLNESWILSDGGEWALSKQPDLAEAVFLPPLSNTGYAFATNTHTFHALLTRHSNSLSYAIVASYPLL